MIVRSKHRPIFLSYTSEHLLYIWILLLIYIDDASAGFCHGRDEMWLRSSSILDHFPNVGRFKYRMIVRSMHRPIFLSYTSENLLYIWILLLIYIDDASAGICRGRDGMWLRSSSILDHFPNVGRFKYRMIVRSKHRPIFLTYTSEHLLYIWILLLIYIDDASETHLSWSRRNVVEVEFHPGPFSECWTK